jgi:hypothetical protein
MTNEAWQDISRELDRWTDRGLTARFWVRDDDAHEMSAQLARLHAFAERYDLNVGLAVIPGRIRSDFPPVLADMKRRFHPMCHGWNHANYGRAGKPEEFGDGRPLAALRSDAGLAYKAFSEFFGGKETFFVPPFGRIAPTLLKELPRIGFAAVSLTGPNALERGVLRLSSHLSWLPVVKIPSNSAIPRFDTHVDVIDWTRRTARDASAVAAELVANLRLRRRGFLPSDRPIGLLTHHLAHDENIWRLCDELLDVLRRHKAIEALNADCLLHSVRRSSPSKSAALGIPSESVSRRHG